MSDRRSSAGTIQLADDNFKCPICLDFAENAVESVCCHKIFCERCVHQLDRCPTCKNPYFRITSNISIRRIIGEIPAECPFCKNGIQRGNLEDHKANCSKRPFECVLPSCKFSSEKEEFLKHLISAHADRVLLWHESLRPKGNKRPHGCSSRNWGDESWFANDFYYSLSEFIF